MNQTHEEKIKRFNESLERLKVSVEEARIRFERDKKLNPMYVTRFIGQKLDDVLENLCAQRHSIEGIKSEEANFIIHYTSISTLFSLLYDTLNDNNYGNGSNNSLRLYDSIHFNDPDEGSYFTRNMNLPPKYSWLHKQNTSHAYIASFIIPNSNIDIHDNLVFWRTYGHEGQGCSLKLRVPHDQLRKVLYGTDEVDSTVKMLLSVLDVLYPLINLDNDIDRILIDSVWKSLEIIRYLYKDEAYEYEKEARIVVHKLRIHETDLSFEYNDYENLFPYIRHYYQDERLKVRDILVTGTLITLGPRVPYRDDVRYCIETMLRRAGLSGPEVRLSEIPYQKP